MMKPYLRILFSMLVLLAAGTSQLTAQTRLEEKIQTNLTELKRDTSNLKVLCNLTGLYLTQPDFTRAIHYGNRLQRQAYKESSRNRFYVLQSHLLLGQAYTMNGNRELAYRNLGQARVNAEAMRDTASLTLVYLGLGLYASNLDHDYYRSLSYFFEGLKLAKEIQDERNRNILLGNIALIYELKKDTLGLPYALECYRNGHDTKDNYLIHIGANSSALLYTLKKEYRTALQYIQEDEGLVEQCQFADRSFTYGIYGAILSKLQVYDRSIDYFQKALEVKESSQPSSVVYSYVEYANTLAQLKRYDEAMQFLQEGEKYAETHQTLIYRDMLLESYANLYKQRGETDKAIHYLQQWSTENDSLFNLSKEQIIRNLQFEYHTDLLQEKLKQQKLEKEHKETQLRILVVGFALILLLSIILFYLYRHTRKLYRAIVVQDLDAFQREQALLKEIEVLRRKVTENREKIQKSPISSAEIDKSKSNDRAFTEEKRSQLFDRLEELMHNGRIYTDNLLSREKVAEMLDSNRTYITQIISENTGKNFTQYVNEYRTREAVRRLSDPQETQPLKALAAELGFNSMTTFYTLFQAATGMTPSQYRKQVEQL